jgi:RNA polymerase sigma-70 factor (ECF subfamily)
LGGTDDFDAGLADVVTSPLSRRRHGRPDSHVEAADTHRAVMTALDELDDDFRVAVLLRDVEEMDYAMIADVLNVPIGTVKSRLHRARAVLKDKLSHLLD